MAKLTDLMGGATGYFWPDLSTVGQIESGFAGHVHRSEDGELILDLVAPQGDFTAADEPMPHSLAATTTAGGALFLDVRGVRYSSTKGSLQVPTRRYRASAVLLGVPLDRLQSDDLVEVTAFFPGIDTWADLTGSEEEREHGKDGRLTSWSVKVRAAEPQSQRLSGHQTLTLTTHWQVDGPDDRRTIYAPVAFTVASHRPAHWVTLVQPLLAVQGLVSMAFDGLVLADGGRATVDMTGTGRLPEELRWWTARLMLRPPGAHAPKSMNEFPSFFLETIGGVAGIRRWITLSRDHPRAAGPLVSRHRFGTVNVETQLLEIATAIEYWVALHRRTTQWANNTTKRGAHALALARHVGKPFADLVGDPAAWGERFWPTYILLKHEPNAEYDAYEVSLLAQTGTILLQCALLNRVAGASAPARAICTSHRHHVTGERTRDLLGT